MPQEPDWNAKPWVMPTWMEKYRIFISGTRGLLIEGIMNCNANYGLYGLSGLDWVVCQSVVRKQIELLTDLNERGMLKDATHSGPF